MSEEMVWINLSEYERLLDVEGRMDSLERVGVDNWEGYEIAYRLHNGEITMDDVR